MLRSPKEEEARSLLVYPLLHLSFFPLRSGPVDANSGIASGNRIVDEPSLPLPFPLFRPTPISEAAFSDRLPNTASPTFCCKPIGPYSVSPRPKSSDVLLLAASVFTGPLLVCFSNPPLFVGPSPLLILPNFLASAMFVTQRDHSSLFLVQVRWSTVKVI